MYKTPPPCPIPHVEQSEHNLHHRGSQGSLCAACAAPLSPAASHAVVGAAALSPAGIEWTASYDELAKLDEGRHMAAFEGMPLEQVLDVDMGLAVSHHAFWLLYNLGAAVLVLVPVRVCQCVHHAVCS